MTETERQKDQRWVEETRAEYLRRAERQEWSLRDDIVQPDGTVAPIADNPDVKWWRYA